MNINRRNMLQAGIGAIKTASPMPAADEPATKPRPIHERICLFLRKRLAAAIPKP